MVLQVLNAKKAALASEDVQLVKLRNGVIIQGADHEDWEDENYQLPEDVEGFAHEAAKVNQRHDTEEDVRPFEMNMLLMGKSTMTERLKKAKMPIQIKTAYATGNLKFIQVSSSL